MTGEYCTCPQAPCPICHTKACDCGCGFEVGSLPFIRLHVESEQEEAQRLASEQHLAEQEAMHENDFLQGMSEQEWREECNPSLSEIIKFEQFKRQDH